MDEATVQKAVIEYLHGKDAIFYVDPGSDQSYELVRKRCQDLSNCGINDSIRIGSKVPDIVGMNAQKEIFAVETKGEANLRKGIGQATDYRRGVHKAYLAAEATELARFEETAHAAGLGTIPVDADGVLRDQITDPNSNIAGTDISSVRRALALKTTRFESDRLDIPPMYRPENALLPVLALKLGGSSQGMSETDCNGLIEASNANYSDAPNRPIRLARTLQLIERDAQRRLHLTDYGETAYTILRGISAMKGESEELQISSADEYRSHPSLMPFLRDRYFAAPPIRLLVKILAAQDESRIEVSEILSEIARESPDVFLSLFCNDDHAFRELMMEDDFSDEEFRNRILELTKVSYLFNFVKQLEVVGILKENSDKVDSREKLVVGDLYWEWDPELIGKIGAL